MQCFIENNLSIHCLQTILQTLAEGLFLIDTDGTIQFCNRALEEMTGKSRDEIIGQKCCTLMQEVCSPPPECTLFESGSITNTECSLMKTDGTSVSVLKNARILRDEDGQIMGAIETVTDISVLRSTEKKLLQLEASSQNERSQVIVGKSRAIKELFNLIDLAAASNATVLITGETGTGKELAAQQIHQCSIRKDSPFVKLNCSALPEALLESELFGHAKGSFTGAIKDRPGRFEVADGGTLFLDEIGELSPLIQVKLLRFLQEKEFERVGENITRKADVRIITATHRNLRQMVQDGTFREDLYYRLKVFPIHIPPLRDRKEDIGLLTDHFIRKFNQETGKSITGLNHDATVTMMDYCWPGNIRELENAIEHAFVTCQDPIIGIFDLPLEIRKVELRKGICATEPMEMQNKVDYYRKRPALTNEDFMIILKECNGNQSEVARRLGIDRTTVWRKMKKLGLL
ncbi:MAG: sigma 54-interacting transcriptional regulator [Fibrobacter sp.]|nr:sigma 54-interacting transcriptional regulator [Fibrobacter sp.]